MTVTAAAAVVVVVMMTAMVVVAALIVVVTMATATGVVQQMLNLFVCSLASLLHLTIETEGHTCQRMV